MWLVLGRFPYHGLRYPKSDEKPPLQMIEDLERRIAAGGVVCGEVQGAVRHVVGERMDCAGMRWTLQRAEALLHPHRIASNGSARTSRRG